MRPAALAAVLALSLAAPGCTLVEHGFGPAGTTPLRLERIASGLEVPWGIAFLPGGDALVTERPGRVRATARRRRTSSSGSWRAEAEWAGAP